MLRQLLAADLEPIAIVEEDSPVADEEREKFLVRISGFPVAPTFTEQLRGETSQGTKCRTTTRLSAGSSSGS